MPDDKIQIAFEGQNRTKDTFDDLRKDSRKTSRSVQNDWEKTNRKTENSFKRMTKSLSQFKGQFTGFFAAAGVVALTRFTGGLIKTATRMEQLRGGLRAVVGSATEARRSLDELRKIALLPGISFEQAVRAATNLRAVKLEADLSERAIRSVGNALAIVGKSGELEGVVTGMVQMTASGKVLAEEINQISSRIPQFRQAMIDAFGTARSEDIQKMGVSVETFLEKTITQLEKLPAANEGAATSISNLQNAFTNFQDTVGSIILPAFTTGVDKLTDALNFLSEQARILFPKPSGPLSPLESANLTIADIQSELRRFQGIAGRNPFTRGPEDTIILLLEAELRKAFAEQRRLIQELIERPARNRAGLLGAFGQIGGTLGGGFGNLGRTLGGIGFGIRGGAIRAADNVPGLNFGLRPSGVGAGRLAQSFDTGGGFNFGFERFRQQLGAFGGRAQQFGRSAFFRGQQGAAAIGRGFGIRQGQIGTLREQLGRFPQELQIGRNQRAAREFERIQNAQKQFSQQMTRDFLNMFSQISSGFDSFAGDLLSTVANLVAQIQSITRAAAISGADPTFGIITAIVGGGFSLAASQSSRRERTRNDPIRRPRLSSAAR